MVHIKQWNHILRVWFWHRFGVRIFFGRKVFSHFGVCWHFFMVRWVAVKWLEVRGSSDATSSRKLEIYIQVQMRFRWVRQSYALAFFYAKPLHLGGRQSNSQKWNFIPYSVAVFPWPHCAWPEVNHNRQGHSFEVKTVEATSIAPCVTIGPFVDIILRCFFLPKQKSQQIFASSAVNLNITDAAWEILTSKML